MQVPLDRDSGRRILILTASMGGGHTQIARELARRLTAQSHHVSVVDLLALMPRPCGRLLRGVYRLLVGWPRLYERVYATFFRTRQRAGERVGVPVRLALPGLRRLVREFGPDVVVSTYHLAALAAGRLRARGELDAPAVTFVTQFAVHDLWLHPAADLELVLSDQAAAEARRRSGRPAVTVGPLVRKAFERWPPPAEVRDLRRALGLADTDRAVLVATGSLGFGGAVDEAVAAVTAHGGWRPVVVAGRNAALRDRLARHEDAVVLGWVEDMHAVMAACDVLVDNACGTTAKEALRLGLPVVTYRPIAGHGRDDARALADLGLTDVIEDPSALGPALDRLLDPPARAARIARGRALFVGDAATAVLSARMAHA